MTRRNLPSPMDRPAQRKRAAQTARALAIVAGLALALSASVMRAQSSAPPAQSAAPTQTATPSQPPQPAPPPGKILFSRSLDSQPTAQPAAQPEASPAEPTNPAAPPNAASIQDNPLAVTDAERSALTFTAYDLDVHLMPASAGISAHVQMAVRNDGAAPLTRLVLQISSSLHWDAIAGRGAGPADRVSAAPSTPLVFAVQRIDTDADHTGQMSEAVVSLPQPLPPGASFELTALYFGAIPPSAERLERIGAPSDQALAADWDAIAAGTPADAPDGHSGGTALRGFGNVLWYPVSAPPVFLGDGARLFQAVGRAKLRQSAATVRLRLAVEYVGDPPDAVFFCGERQPLRAISDNANLPEIESPGIATALFAPHPLGFRTLDLFVTDHPPSAAGTPANPDLIAAVSNHYDALPAYAAAALLVQPLLTDWFGLQPLSSLYLIDHPGQPFEDASLLVRPMRAVEPSSLAPSLAHSLTHVWIQSSHPWIDEGLAQFTNLLWTERTAGRDAALAELQDAARPLALIEPELPAPVPSDSSSNGASQPSNSSGQPLATGPRQPQAAPETPAGESLVAATGDIFYRTKAAAVWWMLRGIVGDDALKHALQAYRLDAARLDRDPTGLERTLENASHMDLRWFFDDWVYRDRGLPDLSIVSVTPSQIKSRVGLPTGWLVAVDLHNDGYAAAEVPVTVRSATATQTTRLRIPGRSSASTRIVFAGTPQQVEVNDGSVPETQTCIHTREIVLPGH